MITRKLIIPLIVIPFSLAACQPQPNLQDSPTNGTTSSACGIQECHGLDITCGSDIPEACTYEYKLGDFCRQFAECSSSPGSCQLVRNEKFEQCKNCVEACEGVDPMVAFDCEAKCREGFE